MLVNSQHYQAFRDELLQDLYWKEADYIIELSITYNEGKTKQYRYKFSIDANEAATFKENIEKLLKGSIDDIYSSHKFILFAEGFCACRRLKICYREWYCFELSEGRLR